MIVTGCALTRVRLIGAPVFAAKTGTAEITPAVISGLVSALGGRENVREIEAVASSRWRVRLANAASVDEDTIRSLRLRGIARPAADRLHVRVGPSANEAVTLLRALIRS